MKGDNVCDEALNTPECQFDGGSGRPKGEF